MMRSRIRSIHPNLLTSERFSNLSDGAEVLFYRLQLVADDEGRTLAEPRLLRARLFPLRDRVTAGDVEAGLAELAAKRLVDIYRQSDGRLVAQIDNWSDFQKPRRPSPSVLEAAGDQGSLGGFPTLSALIPTSSATGSDVVVPGEGEGGVQQEGSSEHVRTTATARGHRIPQPFTVTTDAQEWAETLGLDWRAETAKFVDHFKAAPGARGLKSDWPATWRNWMRRAADGIR